jgi:hypothetical protein
MKRSELSRGDCVATVWRGTVGKDMAATTMRDNVVPAVVIDPRPDSGVIVKWGGKTRHLRSVALLMPWGEWVRQLEERDRSETFQHDAVEARVTARSDALAAAREISPLAKVDDGWVMIPVEDWNAWVSRA